jgi:hypothetical protein
MSMNSLITFKIEDHDLKWLITDLEGGIGMGILERANAVVSTLPLTKAAGLLIPKIMLAR